MGSTQDFDALNVRQILVEVLRPALIYAIDIESNACFEAKESMPARSSRTPVTALTDSGALFQWTAVERAIPLLLGPGAVATWEAESPFGRLTNYAVDDESATGRLEFLELERGLRVAIFDCIWQQEHTFLVRDDA